MDFEFPWPFTQGEWLAWSSAAATILFGLIMLFLPKTALRILYLQTAADRPEALAGARAMSGFYLGLGISCILLVQPLLYLALGFSWLCTVFGRIVSMLSDRGNTLSNWISAVIELVLACLPLAFSLGLVP